MNTSQYFVIASLVRILVLRSCVCIYTHWYLYLLCTEERWSNTSQVGKIEIECWIFSKHCYLLRITKSKISSPLHYPNCIARSLYSASSHARYQAAMNPSGVAASSNILQTLFKNKTTLTPTMVLLIPSYACFTTESGSKMCIFRKSHAFFVGCCVKPDAIIAKSVPNSRNSTYSWKFNL